MSHHKRVILLKNETVPRDPYLDRFIEEGFNPVFIPLLHHSCCDKHEIVEYLQSDEFVNDTKIFIITLQRAVEVLGECMQMMDDAIRRRILQKVGYTVGPATYQVIQELGFTNIGGGDKAGNGLKLAHLMDQELGDKWDKSQRIVFFTGKIRKDIIPRTLISWGYNLRERVIYQTENRPDIIHNFMDKCCFQGDQKDNWIVFFSPQGTEPIVKHLQQVDCSGFRIALIGPTTEEYLLENRICPHIISPKPEANSLVKSIISLDLNT